VIGIDTFGESGKGNQLMDHFGFTPSKIAKKISELV
jgi:Transketolase